MFKCSIMKISNLPKILRKFSNSISISHIFNNKKPGDIVEVKGWVKSLRDQKQNVFIDINDGSTDKKLQIFLSKTLKPGTLSTGASITAHGCLNLSPKGQLELNATKLEVYGECVVADGYPFAPRKQYSSEYVRQHLHFRPRTNKFSALLRVRNSATLAIHNCLNQQGFISVNTPILTSNDCEGAGEVFTVIPENRNILKTMLKPGHKDESEAYFDRKAYLTVSGQLHLEAIVHGLSKVYTLGPIFRAENSRSRLHLSEFYMLEVEIAFIEHLQEIVDFIENFVKTVTKIILERSEDDIKRCQDGDERIDISQWINRKFPILTYKETSKILNENQTKFQERFNETHGLAKEHELFIVDYCGGVPTFVINWPKSMKPFYMKEIDDGNNVAALDLLAPGVGEIVGGSLRENNYEKLRTKIPSTANQLDWYLDLRRFGSVPTGGFGLGFERYLQLILGIKNIKDSIPFPRWPHNCSM